MVSGRDGREAAGSVSSEQRVEAFLRRSWRDLYYAARRRGWTFSQAMAIFHKQCGCWPKEEWGLMPKSRLDRMRRASDVPADALTKER